MTGATASTSAAHHRAGRCRSGGWQSPRRRWHGLTSEQAGEILVRGWAVMIGYWADEAATALALGRRRLASHGDVGRLDSDGCLHFVDRLKDLIKPGGETCHVLRWSALWLRCLG